MKPVNFVILLLFLPSWVSAESISYPLEEIERPLTLPAGMWEVGLGIAHVKWSQGNELLPLASLRYGITDNLEFEPFGLRYRFFRNDQLQTSVRAALKAIGQSTSGGTLALMEVGVDMKYRYSSKAAVLYTFEQRHYQYSKQSDITDFSIGIGPLIQLTERGALALNFAYRELSGTEDAQGYLAKATFTWVLRPDLDLKFEGMYSDIQASGDFRYLGNMYKSAVGTQIKWRF